MIFSLPDLILEMIQGFITPRSVPFVSQITYSEESEYRFLSWKDFEKDIKEDKEWRNLMNTTKIVTELKRKTIYLVLKNTFARFYMNDERFRRRVHGLILDRRNQLSIYIRKSFQEEPFIIRNGSWDGCNMILFENLTSVIDFSTISNANTLRLRSCFVNVAIYNLIGIETMDLTNCDTIEVISNCPRLTRLRVDGCSNLRDISSLTNLITLYVGGCPNLILRGEALQSIRFLWLEDHAHSFPNQIAGLDSLKNLKYFTLDISQKGIKNRIFQLNNLVKLQFINCKMIGVTDYPTNLRTLEFFSCKKIPPIMNSSSLLNLTILKFYQMNMTKQVIDFPQPLQSLSFISCSDLKDIDLYSPVKYLIIGEDQVENSFISNPKKYQNITLWIGSGISTLPLLTVKGTVNFRTKIMS